jgi:1-acyl-sn-glycerol-3-phosphate acyltransferase
MCGVEAELLLSTEGLALSTFLVKAMTTFSADFANQQNKYRFSRKFLRDYFGRPIIPFIAKVTTTGKENIPSREPTLFMINHIAAVDPLLVMATVLSRFVIPLSKIENMDIPIGKYFIRGWGVIPIKRGEVDRVALQVSINLLKQGHALVVAPEGHRSPALQEAKDGLAYLATRANAIISPVAIDGTREFMGNLKAFRRTPVSVVYGKPFRFRLNGRERVPREEMTRMMHEAMYQLASLLPEHRRGFYSDLSKATTDLLEFVNPIP